MRLLSLFRSKLSTSGKWLLSFSFLIILQCMSILLFAQSKRIEGIVSDSTGAPLEKVSVTLKGSGTGVATDSRGHYSIMADQGAVLTFSFTGYNTISLVVGSGSFLDELLKQTSRAMDEVVVIGYGTQRKANLSGAIAVVSGADLMNRPVANLTGSLQGVLPGVTVLRSSGKPGAEGYDIRIRGFSSANTSGALVLVDGIEQDLNLLDPN